MPVGFDFAQIHHVDQVPFLLNFVIYWNFFTNRVLLYVHALIEILGHYQDKSASNIGPSNIVEIASLFPLSKIRRLICYSY